MHGSIIKVIEVSILPLSQVFVRPKEKLKVISYILRWHRCSILFPEFSSFYFGLEELYEVKDQGKQNNFIITIQKMYFYT